MGAKICVLGLVMSFPPYLRSAMVRFPLVNLEICNYENVLFTKVGIKNTDFSLVSHKVTLKIGIKST